MKFKVNQVVCQVGVYGDYHIIESISNDGYYFLSEYSSPFLESQLRSLTEEEKGEDCV